MIFSILNPIGIEIVAFGEFQDGEIVCISLGKLTKVKCPWDLRLYALAQLHSDPTMENNMVSSVHFIMTVYITADIIMIDK